MKKWFVIISLMAAVLSSCTDVDLCPEPLEDHPHSCSIGFSYNWNPSFKETLTPKDSMYILSYRVINMWKSTVAVSSLGNPCKGHYFYNDMIGEKITPPSSDTVYFYLKSGDYKFITFNRNDSEIDYSSVEYYLQHDETPLTELNVIYKTYRKDDPGLRFTIADWVDFNAYGDADRYMQPSVQPIYYDTIAVHHLYPNRVYHLEFPSPRRLTQQVDIEFDIKKVVNSTPFVVDSVFAEIAGIPYIINLASGKIDITKTKKMMFKTNFEPDTETSSLIHCKGTIDVPTIIQSEKDDLFMGPGIMQVMIICSAVDSQTGETLHKTFQGSINLYHTLEKAEMIKWSDDRQSVKKNKDYVRLVVQAELRIDGENVVENPDDNAGLDVWRREDRNPTIVDI